MHRSIDLSPLMLVGTSSHGLRTLSQNSSILRHMEHFSTSVAQIHYQMLIFQLAEGQYLLNLNPCLLGLLHFWDRGSLSIRQQKQENRLMNYVCFVLFSVFCFSLFLFKKWVDLIDLSLRKHHSGAMVGHLKKGSLVQPLQVWLPVRPQFNQASTIDFPPR